MSRAACVHGSRWLAIFSLLVVLLVAATPPNQTKVVAAEPARERAVIGRTYKDSKPAWHLPEQARAGAPNVIYLVLDDVGYAQLGCYGSAIATPAIDRLAAGGLRYTNFHTTALCSPSRACLLTGHNHHANHLGVISEYATGYPGYDGRMPANQATVAQILSPHGYSTFYVGKWHQTPVNETSSAGPFDQWPLGMGFQRFYGFVGGETNQWFPHLSEDNRNIETPTREGYHLSEDLTDQAIRMIAELKQVNPERPFFMNLAYGAAHAPLHAPKKYIDGYKGKFDQGWDVAREQTLERQKKLGIVPANTVLAPRNEGIKAWSELSGDEKKLFARLQEVFAGFLTHCDEQIGRLVSFLEANKLLDNTMIVLVSDNGASQEGRLTGSFNEALYFNQIPENMAVNMKLLDEMGGPLTYPHYPQGWAMAGNTPLKRYKQNTHGGGNTDPCIVHWPAGIKDKGSVRRQYHHLIDVTPTVLEAIGIAQPKAVAGVDQRPFDGGSMRYSFDDAASPSRHATQYFEMLGHRAIYHDGWKAVAYHERDTDFDHDKWELYHVDDDFSETTDLAAKEPAKLQQLVELWWSEAGKNNVLPLDDRGTIRAIEQPRYNRPKTTVTYYAEMPAIPRTNTLDFRNRSYTIAADVVIPESGAEGVLLSLGGRFAGFTLFAKDNKLHYAYNFFGLERTALASSEPLPKGATTLAVEFSRTGDNTGAATLSIGDKQVGKVAVPHTVPITFGLAEGLAVGRDPGTPVSESYKSPFAFTGKINKLVMTLKEAPASTAGK